MKFRQVVQASMLGVFLTLSLAACDQNTELMELIIDEEKEAIEQSLAAGTDVNETNAYGWTPLMHAARVGNLEVFNLLLEKGADVHIQDTNGRTALMKATLAGNLEIAKILLQHSADVNTLDEMHRSALHWTVSRGRFEIAKLLLEHGADTTIKTDDGWTPEMLAQKEGEVEIYDLLRRKRGVKSIVVEEQPELSAAAVPTD